MNAYIKISESSQTNNLMIHLKLLKKRQTKQNKTQTKNSLSAAWVVQVVECLYSKVRPWVQTPVLPKQIKQTKISLRALWGNGNHQRKRESEKKS
jgi:hypothetical protein